MFTSKPKSESESLLGKLDNSADLGHPMAHDRIQNNKQDACKARTASGESHPDKPRSKDLLLDLLCLSPLQFLEAQESLQMCDERNWQRMRMAVPLTSPHAMLVSASLLLHSHSIRTFATFVVWLLWSLRILRRYAVRVFVVL
jgi:hypothetical protein